MEALMQKLKGGLDKITTARGRVVAASKVITTTSCDYRSSVKHIHTYGSLASKLQQYRASPTRYVHSSFSCVWVVLINQSCGACVLAALAAAEFAAGILKTCG